MMIKDTVDIWVNKLIKDNNVTELDQVPLEILEREIKEVQGTILNCRIVDDVYGVACNEYYLDLLEEATDIFSKKIYIRLRDKKYVITDGTTSLSGYFEKDLEDGTNEMIMIAIANFLNYEPSELLNFDDLRLED